MFVKDNPKCSGCPMARLYPLNTYVPPKMGSSLRLVVAEAPGETEATEGEPLVGSAGKMFDGLCRKVGLRRAELTLANTLSCRPPDNVYPTDPAARHYISESEAAETVQHCYEAHLKPLLDSRPWERIDALGEKSLRVLTGHTEGIMKWRGSPLPLKGESVDKVIGVCHPSYLLRDQSMIPASLSDLVKPVKVGPQNYNTTPTLEEVKNFHAKILTFDIETNRFTNQITMVGIAREPHNVISVPFRGEYIAELRRIFAEATQVIGQNIIQFDLTHLQEAGINISPTAQIWDIMLMHHLVEPDSPHDLEYIASICANMKAWKHIKHTDMAWYNCGDVDATVQSFNSLYPRLKYLKLIDLYKLVQVPLAKICRELQRTGIKQDPNRIKLKRSEYIAEMAVLEAKLPKELQTYDKPIRVRVLAPKGTLGKSGKPVKYTHVAGTERVTPWESPAEVSKYLYETLGLPQQFHRKTKKPTADKIALANLIKLKDVSREHKGILKSIVEIRQLAELLQTFLKEDDDERKTSTRIHANFLVHGTNTGRLASSSPNMQNIPSRARFIYVPSFADWVFVEADFSSLENRLAAWYANDSDRLSRMSIPGFNEHLWLARQIYGEQVTKEDPEYKLGKITNHGADGAMGPRKLAVTHGLEEKVARDLIENWRRINRPSADWQERTGTKAQKEGILRNAFGRIRLFWSHSAYTEGIRFLPQSTGADVCFRAMVGLYYDRIGWPEELARLVSPVLAPLPKPSRLVLQVHDSLLVEGPLSQREEVMDCLTKVMTQSWRELGGYYFPIELKTGEPGQSWGELKVIKQ